MQRGSGRLPRYVSRQRANWMSLTRMQGFGTDERTIIDTLSPLDAFQMDVLSRTYEQTVGRSLKTTLEKELSSWWVSFYIVSEPLLIIFHMAGSSTPLFSSRLVLLGETSTFFIERAMAWAPMKTCSAKFFLIGQTKRFSSLRKRTKERITRTWSKSFRESCP